MNGKKEGPSWCHGTDVMEEDDRGSGGGVTAGGL